MCFDLAELGYNYIHAATNILVALSKQQQQQQQQRQRQKIVQSGVYALGEAQMSAVSMKFTRRCLWNSSSACLIDDGPLSSFEEDRWALPLSTPLHALLLSCSSDGLIDDGPLSSFQGRSLSASSFHAYSSLLSCFSVVHHKGKLCWKLCFCQC